MTPPVLELKLQCISLPDLHAVNTTYLWNREETVSAVNIFFFLTTTGQLTASFESNMSQERNQQVNRGINKKHLMSNQHDCSKKWYFKEFFQTPLRPIVWVPVPNSLLHSKLFLCIGYYSKQLKRTAPAVIGIAGRHPPLRASLNQLKIACILTLLLPNCF